MPGGDIVDQALADVAGKLVARPSEEVGMAKAPHGHHRRSSGAGLFSASSRGVPWPWRCWRRWNRHRLPFSGHRSRRRVFL